MASRLFSALAFLLFWAFSTTSWAQTTQVTPNFSWRGYTGDVTPPLCPDRLCHFYPTNSFESAFKEFAAWRSTAGTPNEAESFLNFRVAFPLNYNVNRPEKYPVILMLHGAGESGRIWEGNFDYLPTNPLYDNNSRNLLHGGNVHQQAANRNPTHPQAFPGIIIFPQASYSGSWASGYDNGVLTLNQEYLVDFLMYMVQNYNADINRIAIHGLSNGARGTWDTATKRPDLFAAVLAMSGLPYDSDVAADRLHTTPIRLYQGGTDTNPSPGGSESMINKLVALGGTPQYFLYPTLGHGTWNTAYAAPDFWSWILSKDKRNIYVYGGSNQLCAGATKKFGFSAGFTAYRWKKDGVEIPGETTRYLTITGTGNYTGVYTVEFQRPGDPTNWYSSFPVTITTPTSSYTPELTVTGSLILPYTKEDGAIVGSIGQTETRLWAPAGFPQYQWFKDGVLEGTTTSNNVRITLGADGGNGGAMFNGKTNQQNAGIWTVKVLENSGCLSNSSNSKTLVWNTGSVAPCAPCHTSPTGGVTSDYFTGVGRPVVQILGTNQIQVTWTDTTPNEEYFEIWRYRRSGGTPNYPTQANYNMIATVPANTTTYLDNTGLRPAAEYQYVVRAIANNDGRFSRKSTTAPWPKTNDDLLAPTTPGQLTLTTLTETTATVSWATASDNDVIFAYELFNGSQLVGTLTETPATGDNTDGSPHPPTTYTFTGLEPGNTYLLNVRARDFRNNYSGFPQPLVVTTPEAANGLAYKYYTTGLSLSSMIEPPTTSGSNFNFVTGIPVRTGTIANFNDMNTLAVSIQGADPNNFVFAFDGFIQIDAPCVNCVYTFYTRSDDGSRLYLNATAPLVANNSTLVVNNDGVHGAQNRSGTFIFPAPGKYPIRVTYFENTGNAQTLGVRYRSGNFPGNTDALWNAASNIPNNKLFLTGTPSPTHYYSKATGDLNVLATWGTNTNGTGTAPTSFTANYQVFNIANRPSATLSSPWTVSGTSSRVVLGSNTTLTLSSALTGRLYAGAGSVINLDHTSLPQLTQLHATSTVNMNVPGTVPAAVYGNLNLGAGSKVLPASSTQVGGNLVVDNVSFVGTGTAPNQLNQSTLLVGGNITFNGTSGAPLPNVQERFNLAFSGGGNHILSVNQSDIALAGLEVAGNLSLNFNDAAVHNITIGVPNGAGGLTLRSGAVFNVGNHTLTINGTSGINPAGESGEVTINGGSINVATTSGLTSNLYISDDVGANNVHNLTLSNTGAGQINILGQTNLNNLLTVNTATVNMQGDFVLRSTSDAANGTARIAPLLSGARITGPITAERFMSGEGRIYRYISSPVQGATAAQLQTYFPITGNFTGASVLPPPVTASGPSMFSYAEPNYVQFPSVGGSNLETLAVGRGYTAFIREGVNSTVWKVTGEPNQGTINFTLTGGSGGQTGWNLIGNPYPAPIQWTNGNSGGWTGSGLNGIARIRVNSNGVAQVLTAGAGWDGVVAPGQSFWIQTITSNPTLSIQETAKVLTDGAFYKAGEDDNKILVTLRKANLSDVVAIRFTEEATTGYDAALDGIKLDNSYFNLSSLTSDNKPMALNNTALNYCEQEVKLRITNAAAGTYTLDVTGITSLISQDEVTFIDNFTQTQLVITDALTYPFSITNDAASKADGRFTLRFKKPEVILNQTLKSQAACEQSSPVVLVNNPQPGVTYQAFHNGVAVSDGVMSSGESLELAIDPTRVDIGATVVNVKAGFVGCNSYDLPMTIAVQRDTLPLPSIIGEPTKLVASTENATYQWYLNGTLAPEQTGREWLNPENGKYVVEVFKGTCFKTSDTLEYVVTSVEKPNRLYQLYPNPTRDKFIITLEEPLDFATMRVISTLGQALIMPVTKISEYSAEVDLTDAQTGFYLLQVNGHRYKVLKE